MIVLCMYGDVFKTCPWVCGYCYVSNGGDDGFVLDGVVR